LLYQGQVYLRFTRNATTFKYFLASFSDIVARMSEDLRNKSSGKQRHGYLHREGDGSLRELRNELEK
jgi:hypothetical protein